MGRGFLVLLIAGLLHSTAFAGGKKSCEDPGPPDFIEGLAKIFSGEAGLFEKAKKTQSGAPECDQYSVNVFPPLEELPEGDPIKYDYDLVQELADEPEWFDPMSGRETDHGLRRCDLIWHASSLGDLVAQARKFASTCTHCLRRMNFDSHGAPGWIWAMDEQRLADLSEAETRALQALFMPGAEINFLGCSIGAGDAGERLLKLAGKTFVGRGGGLVRAFSTLAIHNPLAQQAKHVSLSFGTVARYQQPPGGGEGRLVTGLTGIGFGYLK